MPNNVTTAKPKVGGAVFVAPLGTALPTDATTALNEAFVSMGAISDEGYTITPTMTSGTIKEWGGTDVYTYDDEYGIEFKMKFIEGLSINVLKLIYGDDNVTGSLSDGLKVKSNAKDRGEKSMVIEEILKNGTLSRTVIPCIKLKTLGEIPHKRNDAIAYDSTFGANADANGDTHITYYKSK